MTILAKCTDCAPVIERSFDTPEDREAWIGPHIDITGHKVESWEEE